MNKLFKYISLSICVLTVLFFVSCDKEDSTSVPGNETAYFPIGNEINIHPLGDKLNVSFTSDVDWEVVCPNWITFTPSKGNKGTTNIVVSVQAYYDNDDASSRDNMVQFRDRSDNLLKSVKFEQDAAYLKIVALEGSNSECPFEWKKDLRSSYQIETNIDYQIDFIEGQEMFELVESDKNFSLITKDYNFGVKDFTGSLKVVPVPNSNVSINDTNTDYLTKELGISQDHLIFLVVEGSDVSLDNLPAEAFTSDLVLSGFSELGQKYVSEGTVPANEHLTSKIFTVISEKGTVESNSLDSPQDAVELTSKEYNDIEWKGRNVRLAKYEVIVKDPNPECHETIFDIPVTISGLEEVEGANRNVRLIQNPYVWEMTIGKMLADDKTSTSIVINTTGPWEIQVPETESWWSTDNTEWSGVGSKTITFTSSEWNLDLTEDKSADFRITNTCNSKQSDLLTLKKEHYHFNIGENLITDRDIARDVLAELRKKDTNNYNVEIDCSGLWTAHIDNIPDWVSLSDLYNGQSGTGNHIFKLGARTKNVEDYDREVKVVITSETHAAHGIDLSETLTLKQLKHVFGWEPDMWTEDVRNQNCNQPAYIASAQESTFGFETTFSDEWTLKSDEPWVKFHLANLNTKVTSLSGNGEDNNERYIYVTVDNNFNIDPSGREATITVTDNFKNISKSFTISQEPFVFNVGGAVNTQVGPLEEKDIPVTMQVTKGAPWRISVSGNTGLLNSDYERVGTGDGNEKIVNFKTNKVTQVNTGRNATIKISVDGSSLSKSFTVTQDAYDFYVSRNSLSTFDELNPGSQTFDMVSDGPYSVTKPEWLSLSAIGNTYTANAEENYSASRDGQIVFTLDDSQITASPLRINVAQRDFMFDTNTERLTADPLSNLEHTVNVSSSGAWTATCSNSSVVEVEPESGDGSRSGESMNVTFKKNYKEVDYNESITITSSVTNATMTIQLYQPKYEFSVSGNSHEFESKGGTASNWTVKCTGGNSAWEATSSDTSWLTVKQSGDKITLEATSNEGDGKAATAERSATVTVKTSDASKRTHTISVKQKGFTPSTN